MATNRYIPRQHTHRMHVKQYSILLAVFLCLFFHIGFDTIADLGTFSSVALFVKELGINEHYLSLSRGVIDSRDVIYFVGLVIIFGLATRLVIQSRKW